MSLARPADALKADPPLGTGAAPVRRAAAPLPVYSRRYSHLVLALLTAAYALSTIDRNVIGVINQAMKVDLKLTDTQLGLLGGFSFALLYTFLGIPIARVAERRNRASIISVALLLWSGFTMLCGLAGGFLQLAAFRVGVGFGEAGLTPPAQSLISDYFDRRRRSTALSIYAFGIPLGTILGAVLGGFLAKQFGWRVAFMAVGAPGLVMALVMKLCVREPLRGHSDLAAARPVGEDAALLALPAASLSTELGELASVLRSLFLNWPLLNLVLGMTVVTFSYAGASQFSAPYFIREFGLDYATVGLIVGLVGGVSAGIGTLIGGIVADWAGRRNIIWYVLLPGLGVILGTILYICAYLAPTWRAAALLLALPGVFYYSFLGPMFGLIQNAVDIRRRATAIAVVMFCVSLVGQGLGPPFTGWLIDHLARLSFSHAAGGPDFLAACPGGSATRHAGAATARACAVALNKATRKGVIIAYLFSFWGGAHFLLAAFGLKRRLALGSGAVRGIREPTGGLSRRWQRW